MDTRMMEESGVARTAIVTHPGLDPDKQVNEDVAACVSTPVGLLCVVCDGMGGHADGKLAAETAVATILEVFFSRAATDDPRATLHDAIALANKKVHAISSNSQYHAGATCVAIVVHAHGTEVAHVGDSRAHLIHRGTAAVITRDHSKVRAMVDAGMLTMEEARVHPDANQITRALGITENVEVELRAAPVPHMAGDVFVLCSDGLSDLVTPEEMLDHVMRRDEAGAGQSLVGVALGRGGHDNTTVAIVRVLVDADVPAAGLTAIGTPPPPPASPSGNPLVEARETSAMSAASPVSQRSGTTERPPAPSPPQASPGPVPPIQPLPPIAPPAPAPPPEPHAPRSTQTTEVGARSHATLFVGLGLALFAVAILVALYVVIEQRRKHVVVIPHASTSSSAAAPASSLLPSE